MPRHDICNDCADPRNGVVSSPLLARPEALALYLRLHSQDCLPSMCEQSNGKYRVCYSANAPALAAD